MNYMTGAQMRELEGNEGQSIRMPAVALLTIDSNDRKKFDLSGYRVDFQSPYEIYINKQQNVMQGYFTRVAVTELSMAWNVPNVIDEGIWKNNTLTMDISGGGAVERLVVSVGRGFYTPDRLATELEESLNDETAGTATWTVAYDDFGDGEKQFLISVTGDSGPFEFKLIPQNVGMMDDLCNLMGFGSPPNAFVSQLYGSYASMTYTPFFDIVSNQLTKKQNVMDNSTANNTGRALLARIYLTRDGFDSDRDDGTATTTILGCKPFTLYKQWQNAKQIFWDTKEFINVIDITLRDYKGRVLYSQEQGPTALPGAYQCGNSADFQMTLQITET
jgi:hypothetical protein